MSKNRLSLVRQSVRTFFAATVLASVCHRAMADDKYTLHENLHPNQKSQLIVSDDYKVKSTSTTNGVATVTDTDSGHSWKFALTILAVKDGSATHSVVTIDPASFDTSREAGGDEKKSPCPFSGKSLNLIRHFDDSETNDFKGEANEVDNNLLNSFIDPDQEYYPDHPVAVGDTWDNSAAVSKYAYLGQKDKLTSKARLDWVKTINGRQMAQITDSMAIVNYYDGNVEEDQEATMTSLVDLDTGTIVTCDQKESSKYVTQPAEPTQVAGSTEWTCHGEVLPDAKPAATQP